MRGFVVISGAVALAGCSAEQRAANSGATNINAAAAAAQGDIDTYAANTMEVAAPSATTVPKAASVPVPLERLAAKPAPAAETVEAGNRQASLPDTDRESHPCATQRVVQIVGETRVTTRADDTEFERPDRDAPAQRATASVWNKNAGQDLRAGRDAGEQATTVQCATN